MENKFGQLIHEKRKAKNLTFTGLEDKARMLGYTISGSYFNRLEKGRRLDPSVSTLKAVIDTLEIPFDEAMDSLNMKRIYKQSILKNSSITIPDDLESMKVTVSHNGSKTRLTDAQKSLLGNMLVKCYDAVEIGNPDYFESVAIEYIFELSALLEKERYLVEMKSNEFVLTFNVAVMMDKYSFTKNEITIQLEKLDLNAIYLNQTAMPLFLFGEHWMTERSADELKITDKVSVLAQSYNKD